jgi:hypothetical protein
VGDEFLPSYGCKCRSATGNPEAGFFERVLARILDPVSQVD